jgi:hypothetical protein
MHTKRRVHDGIAGAIITDGVVLGYYASAFVVVGARNHWRYARAERLYRILSRLLHIG